MESRTTQTPVVDDERRRAIAVARVLLKQGSGIHPTSDMAVLARQFLWAIGEEA